jgi:UDP-2-acetamido-3-amino-2,3-dideoxy-glucuronate N-acetyltransferase
MNKHPQAIVESAHIGENSSIGAFAHILPGARIGRNCRIEDQVFVDSNVVVEDNVSVGPNAVLAGGPSRTVVRKGASIGPNVTVQPGITIGQGAIIGAGAVIASDVPANTVLAGNPARITGYVGTSDVAPLATPPPDVGSHPTSVAGVRVYRLPLIEDLRGKLSFGEVGQHVPFEMRRYFVSFGVSGEHIRGEHAHRKLHQFLVCVHGRLHVMADDGRNREEFILDSPALALHIPPMVWAAEYRYGPDAVLLVLASDPYDPDDYIRDHSEFLSLVLN